MAYAFALPFILLHRPNTSRLSKLFLVSPVSVCKRFSHLVSVSLPVVQGEGGCNLCRPNTHSHPHPRLEPTLHNYVSHSVLPKYRQTVKTQYSIKILSNYKLVTVSKNSVIYVLFIGQLSCAIWFSCGKFGTFSPRKACCGRTALPNEQFMIGLSVLP